MFERIRICVGVGYPMFLWISSNSCPLNLLLVRSHQAEIFIVKRLIQGRNNVFTVRVEPRSCNQGHRKSEAFTLSATLPTSPKANNACTSNLFLYKEVRHFQQLLVVDWSTLINFVKDASHFYKANAIVQGIIQISKQR